MSPIVASHMTPLQHLTVACHDSGHIHTKTRPVAGEASGRPESLKCMKITGKLIDGDNQNIFEAQRLRPNSFRGRSFFLHSSRATGNEVQAIESGDLRLYWNPYCNEIL